MKFIATPLQGAWLVEPEMRRDRRGAFARLFCEEEMAAHGLETRIVQINLSENATAGIVRGLHFQNAPHEETKVVRCQQGRIHDVIVDLRAGSATRYHWFATELSADNDRQLYVPRGFAHGFQVLEDHSSVTYLMGAAYAPDSQGGLRWDDPALGIVWPMPERALLSERDLLWPLLPRPADR